MDESPSLRFKENLKEVSTLMAMHAALAGPGPGRKHRVEVLNKSAILFLCAAFEAFVEDLATRSFDHIVAQSKDYSTLPKAILKYIADVIRNDKNEIKIWELAGDGWRNVAENYKLDLIRKYIGPFNTPKPHNIESLLHELTGIPISARIWQWKGMSSKTAKEKLKDFVELRGALAHGIKPAPVVLKKDVTAYIKFLAILSVRISNDVRAYCIKATKEEP